MREETLDRILHALSVQDKMQRIQKVVRALPPEMPVELGTRREAIVVEEELLAAPRFVERAVEYASRAIQTAVRYVSETKQYITRIYEHAKDFFYVHVPSWVKVHRAPFHEFGSGLYGLTTPATGDVHIRDDLQGDEYAEVLLHEVAHNLYPTLSEGQIRAHVRSILGPRAAIHTRLV